MRHPARHLRRRLAVAIGPALALTLLLAAPALADFATPESGGSPNADRIAGIYDIALYIALVVFVVVEGVLVYSAIRFRARRGAAAAQIRGNTRLEASWTLAAAAILVILAVLTFAELSAIRRPDNSSANGYDVAQAGGVQFATTGQELPPNGKSLNIEVNGQQYVWRYTYPGGSSTGLGAPYSYEEMVVPTDTTVTLSIVSQDVAHSWWIPKLGGKFDAIPGEVNHTWFKIHRPGVYRGQCAELCGRNHADMVAEVRAVAPDQFAAWLAARKRDLQASFNAAAASRAKLNRQTGAGSVQNP